MSKKVVTLLILSATASFSYAIDLPNYIKTCSKSDPNLSECFKTNANLALETLQYGDENFNAPKLEGVKVFGDINIKPLKHLPFSLLITNGKSYGVEDLRVEEAKVDLNGRHIEILFTSPKIIWQCEYEAQAKTLLGKVSRKSGAYNITYTNGHYLYKMDYNLKRVNGDVEYIEITSHNLEFKSFQIVHTLENIESNPFINGFWEQTKPYFVTKDVLQPCCDIVTKILNAFFKVFSYNEIFT